MLAAEQYTSTMLSVLFAGLPSNHDQLTPLEKMDEKLKSENMQKEQFSERGWG